MEIKIIRKSGCAIICSLCFIALCMPFIDIHNDMESTMYSDVKEAKEYEIDYECMKYLDKHPNGEHSQGVSDILLSKMKKDGDVVRTYKLGRRYTEILEKGLNDILVIAQEHVVCFPNVEEKFGQILCAQDIYKQCKLFGIPVDDDFSQFEPRYENFISSGLYWALEKTISTVREISNEISALYRTRIFRTDHEAVIIYHYIKRIFDERTLPDYLKREAKVKKHHMESRRIAITTDSLQKVMDGVEDKYNNYTLCSDWFEREEDEEEELVRTLAREQASPEDFETLFKYQGEHKMWEAEIARADDFERNSDSFFVNWVDPYKLENMLKFWLKGNITKQQDWYVVWCLMKYTFRIVKDNQDKNAFAARMAVMFPEVEKKCVVESFRKQETQLNHNRHFSEWLKDSDADYNIAKELYYKLKEKKKYTRSI